MEPIELDLTQCFPKGRWNVMVFRMSMQTFNGEDIRPTMYGVFIRTSVKQAEWQEGRWTFWPWERIERFYQTGTQPSV